MQVKIENLSYYYSPSSPYEKLALDDISLEINDGDFFGIIGHTGSGKSTLVSHLNSIIKVQKGKYKIAGNKTEINENAKLLVGGVDLTSKKPDLAELRRNVGMVFQYPEHQLFADTVYEDVAFGLVNQKFPVEEHEARVREAITRTGLDYEEVKNRSPFELSGGQKRRVAIAGVIVTKPSVLVLDEPTAGLDYKGVKEILALVRELKKSTPIVIMISHNMDEVASCCNRVCVMSKGKVQCVLTPAQLFGEKDLVSELGLAPPLISQIATALRAKGIEVGNPLTEGEMIEAIKKAVQK